MLKCRDVSRIVAAEETDDLGLWRRMELRMHLLMCRHCDRYVKQMRALGRGMRRLAGQDVMDRVEQERLAKKICEEVGGRSGSES